MAITKDQMRTAENFHKNLARLMHEHYTQVHDVVIDVDIAFVDVTTMGEVIQSFSNPSMSYTFELDPFSGPAMIDYSLPVAYAFIKKVLGKKADEHTTSEERQAMGEVFKRDLKVLLAAWTPIEKLDAHDAELETNPDFLAEKIARNETVLLLAFEIHGPDFSGLVNVAYPEKTLSSVMDKLAKVSVA